MRKRVEVDVCKSKDCDHDAERKVGNATKARSLRRTFLVQVVQYFLNTWE